MNNTFTLGKRFVNRILFLLTILFLQNQAVAALQLDALQVVDVTPNGFTLLGQANGPATARLVIYSDAAGSIDITSQFEQVMYPVHSGDPLTTTAYDQDESRLALKAKTSGYGGLQVRVTGGQPQTTYYYHLLVDNGTEVVQWPTGAPAAVTTAHENSFVSGSHQVLLTINAPDPSGWLVTIKGTNNTYPVSAVVGDGTAPNQAYINLSNLFIADGTNWLPSGSQDLTLEIRQGWQKSQIKTITLALGNGFSVSTLHPVTVDLLGALILDLQIPAVPLYTTGEAINIGWNDESTASALISLFYDTDQTGLDGTQIVNNIAEDPDGVADQYLWDTTGVADGIYGLYGIISDGSQTQSSYAPALIAIDRTGADTDADSLPDLWEQLFFGSLAVSPASLADGDGDGLPDGREFGDGTHPQIPDVSLSLNKGMNLVALPINPVAGFMSHDWANQLGSNVLRISRLNPATQTVEITEVVNGVPQGSNFPILAHEGYTVEMANPLTVVMQGTASPGGFDLGAGMNLAGFTRVPDTTTAYSLLQAIGDDTVIASIRGYNPSTGRYETAGYHNGAIAGADFVIRRGTAYLFSMKQAVTNISLP